MPSRRPSPARATRWSVTHPAGDVTRLTDALDPRFDAFCLRDTMLRVGFEKCELGYLIESEGPQEAIVFGEKGLT